MQPIYCQSKNDQGSHFLPFHLLNFLTLTFFKVFSSSFQSMFRGLISDIGGGLVVKASCCQIILYILHFAQFPILIFGFSFAISSFGNFLRNVQLKCLSHTKESVIVAIIFWQTKQNHFELFSRRKVSNILPMQNFHNTFLLIFFISDLIRDEKICILLSTYFVFNTVFFWTFEFDERDNQIFWNISLHHFWRWKTYNCQRCTFWSSSFLKQGNLWICQYPLAKKSTFFQE